MLGIVQDHRGNAAKTLPETFLLETKAFEWSVGLCSSTSADPSIKPTFLTLFVRRGRRRSVLRPRRGYLRTDFASLEQATGRRFVAKKFPRKTHESAHQGAPKVPKWVFWETCARFRFRSRPFIHARLRSAQRFAGAGSFRTSTRPPTRRSRRNERVGSDGTGSRKFVFARFRHDFRTFRHF